MTPFSLHRLVLIGLILLACLLRFYHLEEQSIAFDEGFSLAVGQSDWPLLFRAILSDGVHPPFFYVLHKLSLQLFGTTEFGLRFLAVGLSVLGIPALYRLGTCLYNPRLGLMAASLLAINPIHIWLAGEARMYSLLSLLISLNFYAFWRCLSTSNHTARLNIGLSVGFILSGSLIYLVHYFGLIVPIIQFLFLVIGIQRYHRFLLPWTMSQAIASIPLLPWLYLTFTREVQSFGIAFLVTPTLLDPWQTIWNMTLGLNPQPTFLSSLSIIFIGSCLIFSLFEMKQKPAHRLLVLWSFCPIILVWVISLQRSFYADRYLSFTIPALMLLVAYGCERLHLFWLAKIQKQNRLFWGYNYMLVVVLFLVFFNYTRLREDKTYQKDNWRKAATYVMAQETDADLILLRSAHIRLPFAYYYQGKAEIKLTSFNLTVYDIADLIQSHQRIWVVMPYTRRPTHYPMQPLTEKSVWEMDTQAQNLQTFVEKNQDKVIDNRRFLGIEVWLVDLSKP